MRLPIKMNVWVLICLLLPGLIPASALPAALAPASATQAPAIRFNKDTVILNDGISLQKLLWKQGKLYWQSARSLRTGMEMHYTASESTMPLLDTFPVRAWSSEITSHKANIRSNAYTELLLSTGYDHVEIRRTIRIYENTPGAEWGFEARGNLQLLSPDKNPEASMIEDPSLLQERGNGYFYLPSDNHFTAHIARFKEATDYHNDPVQEIKVIPYKRAQYYQGNVLQMQYKQPDAVHALVKLSPLQYAQSSYAGYDFSAGFDGVKIHSPGWENIPGDSSFQRGYSIYLALFAGNEEEALFFYKQYEMSCHHYLPKADNTFTMNTWGDRNRDSRVNESFILKELDAAAELGITHYQIDDGWQQGVSRNSAMRGGQLWNDWKKEDWQLNKQRFPNGLNGVLKKAKEKGISVGLWFNPSKRNRYASWAGDRQIIEGLYEKYGVRWVKIDGLEMGSKAAEKNISRFIKGVQENTRGNVQFNMDVTAGKRGGYFFLNRAGNIFLENRYTDWGNYYPYLTLSNVWKLAKYIPVQRLQIEWLNKWRNTGVYKQTDPMRPAAIPFDYQFALTMMGQPLAWMEATGLPEEAFGIKKLIDLWKQHRNAMQQGIIQSVGDCPDGYSFPGFVSYGRSRIYVLFFRESPDTGKAVFRLPFADLAGKKFTRLYGGGIVSDTNARSKKVTVNFGEPFQFVWGFFE